MKKIILGILFLFLLNTSYAKKNKTCVNNTLMSKYAEITFKLYNKSDKTCNIKIKNANNSFTIYSIKSKSTTKIKIQVGANIFDTEGKILLTATADMEGTEQIIAK